MQLEPRRKWWSLLRTRKLLLTQFRRGSLAIVDEAAGAYDCFKLDDDSKGDNAQNYAWLAGVSKYYRRLIRSDGAGPLS